jgi:membrane-bound acyltransferase YfiQ involved in biofilm formation
MRDYFIYILVCIFMVGTIVLCVASDQARILTATVLMIVSIVSAAILSCFELRQESVSPEKQTVTSP